MRERLLRQGTDADTGERDAELARRKQPREVRRRTKHDAGLRVTRPRHRFEAGSTGAYDGELRRHEESVQGEEPDDREDASEHVRNVTPPDVSTPLARASFTVA